MSEKKMVSLNVAIALGIICIVLVASLVGVILSYNNEIQKANDASIRLDRTVVYANNDTIVEYAGGHYSWYLIANHAGYCSIDIISSTNKDAGKIEPRKLQMSGGRG